MNDTNITPEFDLTFEDFIVGKPQPTLKAIAEIFDVPQQRLYSIAKQPVAGQAVSYTHLTLPTTELV